MTWKVFKIAVLASEEVFSIQLFGTAILGQVPLKIWICKTKADKMGLICMLVLFLSCLTQCTVIDKSDFILIFPIIFRKT